MPNNIPPIGFFIFNRPLETARVFAAIRQAKPAQLFVVADGARNEAEKSLCEEARAVVKVDWPCEVKWNIAEKNLGCGKRPASGISWIFEHVEEAILIEDDCIPDQSFFPFAGELLQKYKLDERVMHIAGANFQQKNPRFAVKESYYASFIPIAFGCWATWARAWKFYDYDMRSWPALRDSRTLVPLFHNAGGYERFAYRWDDYYEKRITDSWDGQWAFACMSRGALCLDPSVHLVENIGFNERGTHTTERNERYEMPVVPMQFPLVHPQKLEINRDADDYLYRFNFGVNSKLRYRLVRPVKNLFPNFYKKVKLFFGK